jgi:DNA-binding transcriptional ArsR family regulator
MRILTLLLDGDASVSDLVTRLGLPQPRVSTHLAQLRKVSLVSVAMVGRQRVYRIDTGRVRAVFEALQALASPASHRSLQATREVRRNTAIRQARTCYDHLAGVAGVHLLDALLHRRWLELDVQSETSRPHYHLTPQGVQALSTRGVDVGQASRTRRQFAYGCTDWTERRAHLGGALGAAILDALGTAGFVQRQRQTRIVSLQKPVTAWLDILP